MCYYRCLLCGNVYEMKRPVSDSMRDEPDIPNWSPSNNSCPVCGGLALPCPEVYCGTVAIRARYTLAREEDLRS
jgi:rubredoxin